MIQIGMGFPKTWTVMIPLRLLLGVLEAGFFPGCVYLLSMLSPPCSVCVPRLCPIRYLVCQIRCPEAIFCLLPDRIRGLGLCQYFGVRSHADGWPGRPRGLALDLHHAGSGKTVPWLQQHFPKLI